MSGQTVVLFLNNPRFFLSHRVPLAQEIQKRGHRVIVLVPPTQGIDAVKSYGFEVRTVGLNRKGKNPFSELGSILSIYRALREIRPDVLHSFTIKPVIYGSLAGGLLGVPKIFNTMTGLGYVFMKRGLMGSLLRLVVSPLFRLAFWSKQVRVIFQNEDDRDLFVSRGLLPKNRTRIVRGSGVDVQRFTASPEPEGPIKILFPARILYDKGLSELIEASRILKAKGLNYELILAGPIDRGNPAAVSKETVENWQAEGLAQWVGQQSDMPTLYQQCHVVCLPSYREGLPLSLLEAGASGRPIVSTDVPGCRDVVVNNENGFLVPIGSTHELAVALEKLITQPLLRHRFANYGRKFVADNFSIDIVISQTVDLYQNELGSTRPLAVPKSA